MVIFTGIVFYLERCRSVFEFGADDGGPMGKIGLDGFGALQDAAGKEGYFVFERYFYGRFVGRIIIRFSSFKVGPGIKGDDIIVESYGCVWRYLFERNNLIIIPFFNINL